MTQIKATIIAHSKSSVNGKEIVTFELEYPRFIHGEIMTHRLFSRNAASSRAIPIEKMIEQVQNNPAMPVHWGKNQAGMQAKEEVSGEGKYGYDLKELVKARWRLAADFQASFAQEFSDVGLHKQVVNRLLEPFQLMKTVLTATEFDNFFWLRKHADAQPEIRVLAEKMWGALQESTAAELEPGDWHVPYFGHGYWLKGCGIPLEDALVISSSCCAQVSYRKLDDSLEKAKMVYKRLVESEPVHASPFEHQGSPMTFTGDEQCGWEEGVTHMTYGGEFWSGNFKSWIQHRQLIENNACWNYKD